MFPRSQPPFCINTVNVRINPTSVVFNSIAFFLVFINRSFFGIITLIIILGLTVAATLVLILIPAAKDKISEWLAGFITGDLAMQLKYFLGNINKSIIVKVRLMLTFTI